MVNTKGIVAATVQLAKLCEEKLLVRRCIVAGSVLVWLFGRQRDLLNAMLHYVAANPDL